MADLKDPLLPRKPSTATATATAAASTTTSSSSTRRPLFQAPDLLHLKKRNHGARSWIRVDAATAQSQVIEVDKFSMMRRCDLPARDLRLLDPLFVYPSTILGREKAIVVNLEQIRCIITADEVLLLNSLDSYVIQYVVELQRRMVTGNSSGDVFAGGGGGAEPDYLPFEFRALEVALEAACTFLDAQDKVDPSSESGYLRSYFRLLADIYTQLYVIFFRVISGNGMVFHTLAFESRQG